MSIERSLLKKIVEGALLAAGKPLPVAKIQALFSPADGGELDLAAEKEDQPSKEEVLDVLNDIQAECDGRGFELKEVASGWRFQVVEETAAWVARLWEEKPPRYTRALLETLALVAYRQPITRGDIESIRGVAVSSNIIKTLLEREWVKVVGHRDVPGRPALYATTKEFLDYFNIKSLDELPSLKEIKDLDKLGAEFDFGEEQAAAGEEQPEAEGERAGADLLSRLDSDSSPQSATDADQQQHNVELELVVGDREAGG